MTEWSDVTTDTPPPRTGGGTSWESVTSESPAVPEDKTPVSTEVGNLLQKIGVAGPLETAAHTVSGAVASIPAGLASTYQLIKGQFQNMTRKPGVLGDTSTGTHDSAYAASHAADAVQNELQYQPRTSEGQTGSSFTDRALGLLGPTEGEWLKNAALKYGANPAVAGGLDVAAQIPSVLLGAKLGAGRTMGRVAKPTVAPLMDSGYGVTPQQAGAGVMQRDMAALANRVQLERDLSHKNAPVTNQLARDDIGMPADRSINDATLDRAADPYNQVYDQVSKLGTISPSRSYRQAVAQVPERAGANGAFGFDVPQRGIDRLRSYAQIGDFDAGDAVARIKSLRAEANRIDRSPTYVPDGDALATINRGIANALEDELDRHVQQVTQPITLPGGQTIVPSTVAPDLLSQFREARVRLGKINDIRSALNGNDVDASKILQRRRRGAQLTGGLNTIADMAENADRSVQVPNKIRDHPLGLLDFGLAGLGGAGHAAVAGSIGAIHPAGFAALFARPLIRRALTSKLYQKYLRNPLPAGLATTPGVSGAAQSAQGTVQNVYGPTPSPEDNGQ